MAFFRDKGPASAIPWPEWNTQQRQRFLGWRPQGLRAGADWLTRAQLADLESTLKLDREGNAELVFAWLQAALANGRSGDPADVVADVRDDVIRFGFGLYQDQADVQGLIAAARAL